MCHDETTCEDLILSDTGLIAVDRSISATPIMTRATTSMQRLPKLSRISLILAERREGSQGQTSKVSPKVTSCP
jgi:hypothetical protein